MMSNVELFKIVMEIIALHLDRPPPWDGPLRALRLLHERLRPPGRGLCPAHVPLPDLPQG